MLKLTTEKGISTITEHTIDLAHTANALLLFVTLSTQLIPTPVSILLSLAVYFFITKTFDNPENSVQMNNSHPPPPGAGEKAEEKDQQK